MGEARRALGLEPLRVDQSLPVYVLDAPHLSRELGEDVEVTVAPQHVHGGRALVDIDGDWSFYLVRRAQPAEREALLGEWISALRYVAVPEGYAGGDDEDVRVLPVRYNSQAVRQRQFDERIEPMYESEFGDLPVIGPGATWWFLNSVSSDMLAPLSHHRQWLRDSDIPRGDRRRHEHQNFSRLLGQAAIVDHLNCANLVCMETAVRRMMIIEKTHVIDPTVFTYEAAGEFQGHGEQA